MTRNLCYDGFLTSLSSDDSMEKKFCAYLRTLLTDVPLLIFFATLLMRPPQRDDKGRVRTPINLLDAKIGTHTQVFLGRSTAKFGHFGK